MFVLPLISSLAELAELSAIVEAVVSMAHSLRLSVVAEGVETDEQLVRLRDLGCELAQGFYFSRPIPAESFMAFYRDRGRIDPASSPTAVPG